VEPSDYNQKASRSEARNTFRDLEPQGMQSAITHKELFDGKQLGFVKVSQW